MQSIIGLGQVNPTVGSLRANAGKVLQVTRDAVRQGATVMVFPELVLSGYPPEDLVLKRHFVDDCWCDLEWLATQLPKDCLTVVGAPHRVQGQVHNSAVVMYGGRIADIYHKMVLPNYGVFDEKRVFEAGHIPLVLQAGGLRLALHICEDSWSTDTAAVQLLKEARIDVLLNLSASPYHRGKRTVRETVLRKTATYLNCTLAYCNMVGGQDELVFDGGSLVLNPEGKVVARARQFQEAIVYAPVKPGHTSEWINPNEPASRRTVYLPPLPERRVSDPSSVAVVEPLMDDLTEVYEALKVGLRDYVDKNGFQKVVVALSGGIDSALVATIAVDALGPGRVAGLTMPSDYTSAGTLTDAEALAENLGIEFHTLPIRVLQQQMLEQLDPLWPDKEADVTEENLQARLRGVLIMALSNKFGWLVLTTGNKSELATGYCTLYGDMAGGFSLIKDVPKTLVYELARWRNHQALEAVIPPSTIERPPSAELRPDQKDADSLPEYDVLDRIVEAYVEKDEGMDAMVEAGFDPAIVEKVVRLIDISEYKRRQGAPGVKITPKAFGRDRRMPITNAYREWVKHA
jgi:NAD+ synthase (glutamine-hydrolysing)